MKINADDVIRDFRGNALQQGDEDLTLGDAILMGLLQPQPADAQQPGQSLKAYKLARKFAEGGSVEITVEEAAFIGARLEKIAAPLVMGRIAEALEGE